MLSPDTLAEPDTKSVLRIGGNFGNNNEFYCLYLQTFYYQPFWSSRGIEFRPFRNVRIHKKRKRSHKIGYYKGWLLEPAFGKQIYTDGLPCIGSNIPTTTLVTYLCGIEDRIVGFRETKKCQYYELIFESSKSCAIVNVKEQNALAIAQHGEETWNFMYIFVATLVVFVFFAIILTILNKKRIY